LVNTLKTKVSQDLPQLAAETEGFHVNGTEGVRVMDSIRRRIKTVFALLVITSVIGAGLIDCAPGAGPNIPKENIPSDIPAYIRVEIEGLYSLSSVRRASAAYRLGTMGTRAAPAVPFLIEMLADSSQLQWERIDPKLIKVFGKRLPYTSPGNEAKLALVKIGKPAVDPLIGVLRHEDSSVRSYAAYALGKIKDPRAVDPLVAALKDEDSDVQRYAVDALSEIKDPRAVEGLIGALKHEDWDVRRYAAYVLGKIKDPRAVEGLIGALKDEDWGVRKNAAYGLGKRKNRRAVEGLIGALKDEDWGVRSYAAYALAKIKDPRAVEGLIGALKDENLDVRRDAAYALGEIRDRRAVEGLIAVLKDKNRDVRRDAAYALGKIKDPRAVEGLIGALEDEDWGVQRDAVDALKEITGKDFGQDPVKWQNWWRKKTTTPLKEPTEPSVVR